MVGFAIFGAYILAVVGFGLVTAFVSVISSGGDEDLESFIRWITTVLIAAGLAVALWYNTLPA